MVDIDKRLTLGAVAGAFGAVLLIARLPKPAAAAPPPAAPPTPPPTPPVTPPAPPPAPPAPEKPITVTTPTPAPTPPAAPPSPPPPAPTPTPPPAPELILTKETDRYIDFVIAEKMPTGEKRVEILRIPKVRLTVSARPESDTTLKYLKALIDRGLYTLSQIEGLFKEAVNYMLSSPVTVDILKNCGYEVERVDVGKLDPDTLSISATILLRPTRWLNVTSLDFFAPMIGMQAYRYVTNKNPQLATMLSVGSTVYDVTELSGRGIIIIQNGVVIHKEGDITGMPIEEALKASVS